ncbi:patatin-like protein [Amycolatopsis sp. CA-230715]|uniref:patatin-like protein n=1 Tax=Amycolatopsis sp. CA-230715 TaxID=2745196 RepID=UPI001C3321A0|nr:patatin-like protein [Amycolatopsis sp. CA-230715]QWF80915.1 putative membrane protein [Amycolatopsis sp. CA-230715]
MREQTVWPQEIRIAMTMVGGASLAVWMGGVATETSALLRASRDSSDATAYGKLLRFLNATVCLDVLTGTSAGGINAACLGLSEAYRSSPASLRDIWLETGSLDNLIRDPSEPEPRSVLDGDRVLLGGLRKALRGIVGQQDTPVNPDVTVLLTGTMIDGETTRYDDALGNLMRDTEHRLLFRFERDLWQGNVFDPLALAARCSASFPGAFELARMPVGAGADEAHPDMAAFTDATRSHWLTDGGVLLNKPIGPALREIFERKSEEDVRRLLLYVVPSGEDESKAVPVDAANPPLLAGALGHVLTALTSQTISAELDELTRHNDAVVRARATRVSLAGIGLRDRSRPLVDDRMFAAYRARRVQTDAAALVRAATRLLDSRSGMTQVRQWTSGVSGSLRAAAAEGLRHQLPERPPPEECGSAELAGYRTSAVDDAVATGLQLVNAGFRLLPTEAQVAALNSARGKLHDARRKAARKQRLADWVKTRNSPALNEDLIAWITALAEEWATEGVLTAETDPWPELAGVLVELAPTLRSLATAETPVPSNLKQSYDEGADTITTLLDWLGLPGTEPAVLNARLLDLHIAAGALLAQPPSVDQRVDLVQVSADTRSLLDLARRDAKDKLTGMQANAFGAFYKASWRANDWMWGRVDGAGWLIQCLLDPKRLLLLRELSGDGFAAKLEQAFTEIGWQPPCAADDLPQSEMDSLNAQLAAELAFLGVGPDLKPLEEEPGEPRPMPVSMPVTAMVLARSRQLQIAAEELPVVAKWSTKDMADAKANGVHAQDFRDLMRNSPPADEASTAAAFRRCEVSKETFGTERGSTLLTRTLIKTGAAGVNAAAGAADMPTAVKPVAGFAKSAGKAAWWITQVAANLRAPWNLLAGVVAVVLGLVLGDRPSDVLQFTGLALAAGAAVFLVASILTLRRDTRMLLSLLGALAGAALLFAAYVPGLRDVLFGWLGAAMDRWQHGSLAWLWIIVSALLVLPAVVTPVGALTKRAKKKRALLAAKPTTEGSNERVASTT